LLDLEGSGTPGAHDAKWYKEYQQYVNQAYQEVRAFPEPFIKVKLHQSKYGRTNESPRQCANATDEDHKQGSHRKG
jgi:hypothetical protein